jgi:hypothetical protein
MHPDARNRAPDLRFIRQTLQGLFSMAYSDPNDRLNDTRLMTPLLIMALIVACGFLYFAFLGAPASS